jgi:lysophospholipase L1-like esterase
MIRFHIPLQPRNLPVRLDIGDAILLTGSCFTEHMAARFRQYKFKVLDNPNGILFNPVSIARALDSALDGESIETGHLFEHDGLWAHWDYHSRWSDPSADVACRQMNQSLQETKTFLATADWLLITLGTAWVFERPDRGIVANCHKMPASGFTRRLLRSEEIVDVMAPVLQRIKAGNPDLRVILTVSPVRHLRDGFVENNRSKASLITAVHDLAERLPDIHYFPAYELIIDDLRDHRFYAEDLVHPNYQATAYVWEKFAEVAISGASREAMKEIDKLQAAIQHRPLHSDSDAHAAFRQKHLDMATSLAMRFPRLDFSAEIAYFR